ncbi:hypothetical protein RND71_014329 [Anisodus tanguticus]|uniref:Uncharacterized protein n=1 Tax=Anisodus tanguticus TaxID=243964 RepID=A0AAE1S8W6_9SOLA|nr:hypothetical protein RND71_014329 [Anisodus tanguticus]
MESNRHPKQRKCAQFPSNPVKDSNLTMPILPAEIITRLPVSKSWLDLISTREFIKTHLRLSANNKNKEDTHPFDLDYPNKNASKDISIVGSCNGLIFFAHYSEYSLLWNPTIRKYKNLPDLGLDGRKVMPYMVLDMMSSVMIIRKMKLDASGLFVNRKLHWDTIIAGPNLSYVRTDRNIISFGLATEKWEKMEKPFYGVGESDLCVGTLGSDLCVYSDDKGTHLGAWIMKEYGVKESWIKIFTIRYPNDQILHPHFSVELWSLIHRRHYKDPTQRLELADWN